MSAVVVSSDAVSEDGRKTLAALVMRRQGKSYEDIALELGVQPWEARQFVSFAYARLSSEQADELRAQVEDRLDDIIRRLYADLRIASDQPTRNAIYALLLKTEAQRSKLLGLDIPAGTPDYQEVPNA